MNITTFYFSGTGNTWWGAKQFEEFLSARGHKVTTRSIESPELENPREVEQIINSSDKIIIGYPIYASDMPRPMRYFLEKLPAVKTTKSTAVYCTQSLASGDGALFYRKELAKKGYQVEQAFHIIQGNNFYVPQMPFLLTTPEKQEKLNTKSRAAIEKYCDAIDKNEKYLMGNNPAGYLLGNLQRAFAESIEKSFSKTLWVDQSRCNNCRMCVKSCPMNNITFEKGGVTLGKNCNLCMRCYQFCSPQAINMTRKTLDREKFPRYKGPVEKTRISDIRGGGVKSSG